MKVFRLAYELSNNPQIKEKSINQKSDLAIIILYYPANQNLRFGFNSNLRVML